MIKVGDQLPAATLFEYIEVEGNGCSIGPNPVDVAKATAGKTIALFALPGAYTPTCSAKHLPGFKEKAAELKAKGVDTICKKVGEEATEIVIAAKNPNPEEVKYEISDFLYHMMVLMAERGITWDDIMEEMAKR